jgi:hypothetical protein
MIPITAIVGGITVVVVGIMMKARRAPGTSTTGTITVGRDRRGGTGAEASRSWASVWV